jgi:NhaP-type Na+/H+ or K+/H+ antiporter
VWRSGERVRTKVGRRADCSTGLVSFLTWTALASGLLLVMALASSYLRNLPITTSALYLGFGLAIGPAGFDLVALDLLAVAPYAERITELAVVVALFVGGLKLRLPVRHPAWYAAYALAGPVMVLSILGIAAVAHLGLGLPLGPSLVLGAVLAPTDPVLASAIAVNDADDHDRMRYGLSGEAGLNDGTAFPFVVLALAWDASGGSGSWLGEWAFSRLLWAVVAAIVLGYGLGKVLGRVAIQLRTHQRDTTAPSDLLALALIGIAYVAADSIGAWGFLSVFAAGVGLRAAEVRVVADTPHPDVAIEPSSSSGVIAHPPAEALVDRNVEGFDEPAVAAGVLVSETLSFGDTVERLVEVGLIVAVGIALGTHWDGRAIWVAAALFLVIRPLATHACLTVTQTTIVQRWLMGWFGIRGIGSLYYLAYSLQHGLVGSVAHDVVGLTISVVALSIVIHGVTTQPLLNLYERSLDKRGTSPRTPEPSTPAG